MHILVSDILTIAFVLAQSALFSRPTIDWTFGGMSKLSAFVSIAHSASRATDLPLTYGGVTIQRLRLERGKSGSQYSTM